MLKKFTFLLVISNIPSKLRNSNCLIYANDVFKTTKVFKTITFIEDCIELEEYVTVI